jgi:hypothetical protein
MLLVAIHAAPALANNDQPTGVKFGDGWMMKWGDTMETLALHLPEVYLKPYSSGGFSQEDIAHAARHATIDIDTKTWKWQNGWGPIFSDNCTEWAEDDSSSSCVLSNNKAILPQPFKFVQLEFQKDQLYSAHMELSPAQVPSVEEAFVRRLGKPTSRKVGVVQNQFGASFDQTEATWLVGEVRVVLKLRDFGSLDSGGLRMEYLPIAKKALPPPAQAPF